MNNESGCPWEQFWNNDELTREEWEALPIEVRRTVLDW